MPDDPVLKYRLRLQLPDGRWLDNVDELLVEVDDDDPRGRRYLRLLDIAAYYNEAMNKAERAS